MIKINQLNKYFNKGKNNEIHVIHETSLELPSTGLISFLGHSGCGKTTLLNVLGGLDKASGSIVYDDFTLDKYSMSKMDSFRSKHIGYVFQNYNLLLEESVYDNLRIALDIIGVTDPIEVDKRIEYTLKAVGMFKFRKKKAYALSGGQQQRVSIARALVKNCKIIIADEPTGNLDSQNTIEVMNILKKVSKNALVLLVTHEQNIADFYSDIIFKLEDGKVVERSEGNDLNTLSMDQRNVAYLKDMKKTSSDSVVGEIELYQDNEETIQIDAKFIIKNGTIYLQSSQNIKLVSNSNLKIVDDHYQELKKEDISDFQYDTSWYQDSKKNSNVFKRFFGMVRSSFIKLISVKKRIKFLYFSLVCIGIILGISVVSLMNVSNVSEDSLVYNRNYSSLLQVGSYSYSQQTAIIEAYEQNGIENLLLTRNVTISYREGITLVNESTTSSEVKLIPFQDGKVELAYGKKPSSDSEICIGLSFCDMIIQDSNKGLSYETVLNTVVRVNLQEYTICGITKNDNKMIYSTPNTYFKFLFFEKGYYYDANYIIEDKEIDIRFSQKEVYNNQRIYSIVEGRDVVDKVGNEVLVSKNYFDTADSIIGKQFDYNGIEYEIVGVFEYPYETSNTFIFNQDITTKDSYYSTSHYSDPTAYCITQGRDVENNNEIIADVYSGYEVGDKVGEKTIVGLYTGSSFLMNCYLSTSDAAILDTYRYDGYIFNVKNEEVAKTIFSSNEFEVYDMYETEHEAIVMSELESTTVFLILFGVLLVVSAIFIYFIMRSRMISDIYSIGVYRALGASRTKLSRNFLIDVVVLTTITTLIGYIIAMFGYVGIKNVIEGVLMIGPNEYETIFAMKYEYMVLGGLLSYGFMILFGMLPILFLLRKTPAQIFAKYDI